MLIIVSQSTTPCPAISPQAWSGRHRACLTEFLMTVTGRCSAQQPQLSYSAGWLDVAGCSHEDHSQVTRGWTVGFGNIILNSTVADADNPRTRSSSTLADADRPRIRCSRIIRGRRYTQSAHHWYAWLCLLSTISCFSGRQTLKTIYYFLTQNHNSNSIKNCLCTSVGFGCGKTVRFRQHLTSNSVTPYKTLLTEMTKLYSSSRDK